MEMKSVERSVSPPLSMRQRQELHDLARKLKGTYLQLLQLLHELDIPFKS